MNLKETIYKRQSIRNYEEEALNEDEVEQLRKFIDSAKVLNSNIQWSYDIVSKDQIKSILNWRSPQYILLFSEEKENYKENIGFIFQQVDLYLQSSGIGSCWLGMISPNKKYQQKQDNQKYLIGMAIGKPEGQLYRQEKEFNRKDLTKITDKYDEKLKAIQYAPSAVNSQPWYITHNSDGTYNIYREKLGLIKRKTVGKWNEIDIGIALAHIYIENEDTFEFFIKKDYEKLKSYIYEGSFKI